MRINPGNAAKHGIKQQKRAEHADDQNEKKTDKNKRQIGKGGFARGGFGWHG